MILRNSVIFAECAFLVISGIAIDLLNFVFLRDCPSLASQSSNFHITCGTFPAFLCFPASFDIRDANITYRYYYTRFVHTIRYYAVGSHARPARINPAIYGPATQRSAVRSHAVRCRALRCGAVSLRCVLSFEHRAVPGIMRVVVYGVLLFLYFLFYRLRMYLIFHAPLFFPPRKIPSYCRSERNTGNESTQHS